MQFDFITDPDFRASLESDYRELEACIEQGAWKGAQVLAGSLIEAVLADYLIVAGKTKPDPLKMTLEQLIEASLDAGALSEKTASLATGVRHYRNLIHPGRLIRLKETLRREDADVAKGVVGLIVRDIAAQRESDYGPTAEQLASKFAGDTSATAIAAHLFSETKPNELRRLLTDVLPTTLFELVTEDIFGDDQHRINGLRRLYRDAVEHASKDVRRAAMEKYIAVLKEDSGRLVDFYDTHLVVAADIAHLPAAQRQVAKDHLLSRLREPLTRSSLRRLEGLGGYLAVGDVHAFVDPLVRAVVGEDADLSRSARDYFDSEYWGHVPKALEKPVQDRLEAWIRTYVARKDERATELVRSMKIGIEDIPF